MQIPRQKKKLQRHSHEARHYGPSRSVQAHFAPSSTDEGKRRGLSFALFIVGLSLTRTTSSSSTLYRRTWAKDIKETNHEATMSRRAPTDILGKLVRCQQILGYEFKDPTLLRQALHVGSREWKRLASAGDTYVQNALADRWYERRHLDSSDFSKIKMTALSNANLSLCGFKRGINECTIGRLSPGQRSEVKVVYEMATTVEALLAAVYRDTLFVDNVRKQTDWDLFEAVIARLGINHRLIASTSDLRWAIDPMHGRKIAPDFFRGHHLSLTQATIGLAIPLTSSEARTRAGASAAHSALPDLSRAEVTPSPPVHAKQEASPSKGFWSRLFFGPGNQQQANDKTAANRQGPQATISVPDTRNTSQPTPPKPVAALRASLESPSIKARKPQPANHAVHGTTPVNNNSSSPRPTAPIERTNSSNATKNQPARVELERDASRRVEKSSEIADASTLDESPASRSMATQGQSGTPSATEKPVTDLGALKTGPWKRRKERILRATGKQAPVETARAPRKPSTSLQPESPEAQLKAMQMQAQRMKMKMQFYASND